MKNFNFNNKKETKRQKSNEEKKGKMITSNCKARRRIEVNEEEVAGVAATATLQ